MGQDRLDVNNILRNALAWKVANKASPREVRDYILRVARENGHEAVLGDKPDILEVKFSSVGKTIQTIGFDCERWRVV